MRTLTLIILLLAAVPVLAYEVGDAIEDFTLPDLAGVDRTFSDLRGEIVVMNFFATWCPGCNEEADSLEHDIWQTYSDQGVRVVAIDVQEQAVLVDGWRQALGVTYDIWMAPDWTLFGVFTMTGSLPYNTVIDADGVLRYAQSGYTLADIVDTIEQLLEPTAAEVGSWGDVKNLFR